MAKDKLEIGFVLWVEDFDEEGEPKEVKYSYEFPVIENETTIELYKLFLETICLEVAKLDGATNILGILAGKVDADQS